MKYKTINVKCSFVIPVKVPDSPEWDEYFQIEDNSCPGTSQVGLALSRHMEKHDKKSTCWACALNGKNEIV